MATTEAKTRKDSRPARAKSRRQAAEGSVPLRRVVRRSRRYPEGKCHVCGRPQMKNKVLCAKHEAMWRAGEIRLSRHGADRQLQRGNQGVVLFLFGERQETRRRGRPRKETR